MEKQMILKDEIKHELDNVEKELAELDKKKADIEKRMEYLKGNRDILATWLEKFKPSPTEEKVATLDGIVNCFHMKDPKHCID